MKSTNFFLLKLQGKMTNFFRSVYIAFPAFYTGPYTKRSKNFFQKYVVSLLQIVFKCSKTHLRHFSTLETCSEYDFEIKNIFLGSKIRFFLTKITKENYQFFSIVLYSFPSVLYRALYKTIEKKFFKNTSFPYFKSYSNVRKHISDNPRHSRHVQNTILISKTYLNRILGKKIYF